MALIAVTCAAGHRYPADSETDRDALRCPTCNTPRVRAVTAPAPTIRAIDCPATGPLVRQETR